MVALQLSASGGLVGRTEPRLSTDPLRPLTRETSLGFEAIDFISSVLGVDLMPWQRWLLIHMLEIRPDGTFRYRTVLVLVGRQSGKTTLLKCLALWMMYSARARLVLGAAQNLEIARESWSGACEMVEADPGLSAELDHIRRASGEQALVLTSGARYKIAASKRSSGRGLSVDLLILDELREHRDWEAWAALSKTTMARKNALTVGITNAGDDESVVLNSLRAAALEGEDDSMGIFEWSAPYDCDVADEEAWTYSVPALGYTIDERTIRANLKTDSAAVFRTEILCQRVESMEDAVVSPGAWNACLDSAMTLDVRKTRTTLCFDAGMDLGHATLVAAQVGPEGRVRVATVKSWRNVREAVDELPEWVARIKPVKRGFFPGGPAAAVRVDLEAAGFEGINAADCTTACQEFAELISNRGMMHAGDALLTAHVLGAKKWKSGDGWRFVRRGAGHVDAAYAAAGAARLVRSLPPERRVRLITAKNGS